MNNMYGAPGGPMGGIYHRPGPPGLPDPDARYSPPPDRTKRVLRWGTGIILAGFLAGGGIALALTNGSNPAAAGAPGGSGAPALSGGSPVQGTTLNSELNAASGNSAAVPRVRWALARLRALGGVDGEFTFQNKTGFHTLAFERGTIQSVSGSGVVVHAKDGTTWTWLIVSDTAIRQNGNRTTTSALAAGQTVFAGGPVINGAKDARLIVIRPDAPGSGSSSVGTVSGPPGTSVS